MMTSVKKSSIAYKALKPMSFRMSIVMIFCSLIGYIHISHQLQEETLKSLNQYLEERGQREQVIFLEAMTNHRIFADEFLKNYDQFPDQLVDREFSRLVEELPDGSWRSKHRRFNGKTDVGLYLGKPALFTHEFKKRVVVATQLITQFGPAWRNRFQDTYVTFPENGIALFWPEAPNWVFDVKPDFDMTKEEYVYAADEFHNPERKSVFTGLFLDDVGLKWMSSGLMPVYGKNSKLLLTISHDVMVEQIIQRSLEDKLPGTSNFIFRKDGRLIAHPDYMNQIQSSGGSYSLLSSHNEELKKVFESANSLTDENKLSIIEVGDNFYGLVRIQGPEWIFVTKYPKSNISAIARASAIFLILIGLLSLAFEIAIVLFLLRDRIVNPLKEFIHAINELRFGELQTELDIEREDELGDLGRAFIRLSKTIMERDSQLEQHTAELEQKILDRTNELIKQQQMSIQVGKMAALGQMAGGMAHEINTPLAALQLNIESFRRRVSGTEREEELTPIIDKSLQIIDKVAAIIQSLRTFSRDGSSDKMQATPLRNLVDETHVLCAKKFQSVSVVFYRQLPEEDLILDCQPTEICQVLLNLINNSYDAIENLEERWIKLEATRSDDFCEIRITDSGKGLPQGTAEKLFQPFFTTKDIGKGTGIGLSLSYGIIKKHNGEIFLDRNHPNTSFVIRLPLRVEENPLLFRKTG